VAHSTNSYMSIECWRSPPCATKDSYNARQMLGSGQSRVRTGICLQVRMSLHHTEALEELLITHKASEIL
jgi:hypothetical protein